MNTDKNLEQDNPKINIIDLDNIDSDANINYDDLDAEEEEIITQSNHKQIMDEQNTKSVSAPRNFKWIWHLAFFLILILCILFIVYRFSNWGQHIDLDQILDNETDDVYEVESFDNILPHLYEGDEPALSDGVTNIVFFGNGPWAEERDSSDNVVNRIAELSGANVYNCAVSSSYLAATNKTFSADRDPMDAFNFYWLTTLAAVDNTNPIDGSLQVAADTLPPEAEEVYDTLRSIDFSTIDVIAIMYDASDYLASRPLYNDENETDIQFVSGNLSAGIELIQSYFPHIRIIVMSPTYAYAINEEGEYVSSDMYYHEFPLSTYAMMVERVAATYGVSYVDNIYGTINERNASEYLLDNVHLNNDGKQLLAERFVYALQYYDE